MKLLVIVITLALLTSCGLQNQIDEINKKNNEQGDDIYDLKRRVALLESQMSSSKAQLDALDTTVSNNQANINSQIADINSQVSAIEAAGEATQAQVDALQDALAAALFDAAALSSRVGTIEGDTAALQLQSIQLSTDLQDLSDYVDQQVALGHVAFNYLNNKANVVNSTLNSLQSQVGLLQNNMNAALVQLATLQGYTNIVSIKDPCGKQGSYDEVFLKLSTGKYLSSFSDNANGLNTRFTVLTDGSFRTTDATNCNFTVSGGGTVISNEHN